MCSLHSYSQGSGYTLTFDGNNESINIGNQVANQCRTIEMWFKPTVTISSSTAIPKSLIMRDYNYGAFQTFNEFGLFFYPNSWGANAGKLCFTRSVGASIYNIFSNNDTWEANHWYHVSVTMGPLGGMRMYINGVLQIDIGGTTSAIGTQPPNASDNVYIGKWGSLNIRYFLGEIDEVRFWETERSQLQIRDMMCSSLVGNEVGLRGYWNFDTGTGTTLVDNSINNYAGILQSMSASNWIYSGAPIGNISTYAYPGNLTGTSLTLSTAIGDEVTVDNIVSISEGVQIYKVNSPPNSLLNLSTLPTNNYYGVFLTSISGTYNFTYDYSLYGCSSCDNIFSRNDNSEMAWQQLAATSNACVYNLPNQSTVNFDYRAEYIISSSSTPPNVSSLGNDTTLCAGSSLVLTTQAQNASFIWQDNSTDSNFIVTQSGAYWVEVISACGSYYDTIVVDIINPPFFQLGNDTLFCQPINYILSPNTSNINYVWQDGSTNQTYTANQSGIYWVTGTNVCGNWTDSISIQYGQAPTVSLGNDTTLCQNESLILDATSFLSNYQWQDNSSNATFSITQPGIYWVTVSNSCGVTADSLTVEFNNLPNFNLGPDIVSCIGDTILLSSPSNIGSIIWSDGSVETLLIVSQTGVYSAIYTENNCSTSDLVEITFITPPILELASDTSICFDEYVILSPTNTSSTGSYLWSTGSEEPFLYTNNTGNYTLSLTNQCGIAIDSISVENKDCSCTFYVPNTFTPDGSQYNEYFRPVYDCEFKEYQLTIYNRWGELIFTSNTPTLDWDGTYKGFLVQSGIYTYVIKFITSKSETRKLVGHISVLY
ncbi:MAG: gliding motility-associated C-terminal domain-containing protein [Fluviicola sp.]|nr:gliding motility-associated C-terminal domain-containing protein [Fluviicola sp.]